MTNSVITYPIPLFQNVIPAPENYKPSRFFISDISLGIRTTVTTTVDNNYYIGQLVRLLIPNGFGSYQLNEKLGFVIAIPASDQVLLDIDSTMANSFVNASLNTKAQIVAVGDNNTGNINSNGSTLALNIPGSFINIS